MDNRLHIIMKSIHQTCLEAAEQYGSPENYVVGANIARFVKVVNTMIDQGVDEKKGYPLCMDFTDE